MKKQKRQLLLNLFLATFFANGAASAASPDSLALVTLYQSLHGDQWAAPYQWDFSQPVNTWYGVCLGTDERVRVLDLDGNFDCQENFINDCQPPIIGITGSLPPSLNLPELRKLLISNAQISGNLPAFDDAPQLQIIDLHCNLLSGNVPNFNLQFLTRILLSSNQFTGTVPSFSNCVNLEWIDLRYSELTGGLPSFSNLGNLSSISVRGNNLDGTVPHYQQLSFLGINENRFTFEDLLPGAPYGNGTNYLMQDSVLVPPLLKIPVGFPYTVPLGVDNNVTSSTYLWKKDGIPFQTSFTNQLTFDSVTVADAGVYWVDFTNSIITGLTLHSLPFNIETCFPGVLKIDTFLCPGESLLVNGILYDENNPSGNQTLALPSENGCDSIICIRLNYPSAAQASSDSVTCTAQVVLEGNLPPGSTGEWMATGAAVIESPLDAIAQAKDLSPGLDTFIWILVYAACPGDEFADSVFVLYDMPPTASDDAFEVLTGNIFSGNFLTNDAFDPMTDTVNISLLPGEGMFEYPGDGNFSFDPGTLLFGTQEVRYELCSKNCPEDFCSEGKVMLKVSPGYQPIVITPNGDGLNDAFVLKFLADNPDLFPENRLLIVNKLGNQVLDARNYQNDWGGNYKGHSLPQDTYYYTLWPAPDREPVYGRLAILR